MEIVCICGSIDLCITGDENIEKADIECNECGHSGTLKDFDVFEGVYP